MKIGGRIKGLRIEKGFSTDLMAEHLGISDQTYRKYESDRNSPDLNSLEKIAQFLGKNLIDLLPDSILFTNNDQKGGIALAYQSTIRKTHRTIGKKNFRKRRAYKIYERTFVKKISNIAMYNKLKNEPC